MIPLQTPPPAHVAPAPAPDPERQAVLALAQAFLDALIAKDGEAMRRLCLPEARITSIRPGTDGPLLRHRTLAEDIAGLTGSKERLLERMWSPTVLIQGPIALVWAPYDFHRNEVFSHSGIDTFTCLKTAQGWRISDLAYSVEPSRPSAHPAGPPKAKP